MGLFVGLAAQRGLTHLSPFVMTGDPGRLHDLLGLLARGRHALRTRSRGLAAALCRLASNVVLSIGGLFAGLGCAGPCCMSGVQTLTVAEGRGRPAARPLAPRRFPHVPQGRIEKMCRKGEIRVDGGRVKPATRVEEGQAVRVPPLPEAGAPAPPGPRSPTPMPR
jgi:hypothetical protein